MALNQGTSPGFPQNIGGTVKQVDASTPVDNVFTYSSGGKVWQRIFDGGNSVYRASWLNITGAPTDKAALINIALANSAIKTLEIDADITINSAVTTTKTFKFLNGGIINGTGTLTTPKIDADYNQQIFGSGIIVVNPKSATGKFSAQWWGVVADGSTDNTSNLNRVSTAVSTSYQKRILFPGSQLNYLISSTVTIASNVILEFENGAILNVTGVLNGGIIDAAYTQQIFTPASIVNPSASMTEGIFSVRWMGADNTNVSDAQPAIQAAVDTVIRNNISFKTVWFPNGTYKINTPIIAYKWTGTNYAQHTTYLKGENSFWLSPVGVGAKIMPTFKDTFAIGIQRGKGCKIYGLYIQGLFAPPFTQPNYAFYSCTFDNFIDATCRDTTYSPYTGIALDPFTNSPALPADGGYPGLTSYYRGTGGASGSTGTEIEDIFIGNFVVGICSSPNGTTLNQELCHITKLQLASCKLGVSGGQAQEKGNTVDKFACWASTHTIFATGLYGAQTPGNWYVTNGNMAGAVNRFIYNKEGGYYPSYFSEIFAESIGTFGTLNSGVAASVNKCIFNFISPSDSKTVQGTIISDGGMPVAFNDCLLRYYGAGASYPICIYGNPIFRGCVFNEIPFCANTANGYGGAAKFIDCAAGLGLLGVTNSANYLLSGTSATGMSPYGNFNTYRPLTLPVSESGYSYDNNRHSISVSAYTSNITIAITGANRQFTYTVPLNQVYKNEVNRIIYTIVSGSSIPVGVITDANSGTGVITVSYTNYAIVDGVYFMFVNIPLRIGSTFIGDTTIGSPTISNVKLVDGATGVILNSWVKCYINNEGGAGGIDYAKVIAYNTGTSTITLATNVYYTRVGVFFSNEGTQFLLGNTANYTVPTNYGLQQGGAIRLVNYGGTNGVVQEYIVSQTGYLDPSAASDTRRAYFIPKTIFQCSGNPEGIVAFPAGSQARDIVTGDLYLKASTNTSAINGGNTGWVKQQPNLAAAITGDTAVTIPLGAIVIAIATSSTTTQSGLLIGTTVGGSEIDSVSYTGSATAGSVSGAFVRGTGANTINFTNIAGTVNYRIILQ